MTDQHPQIPDHPRFRNRDGVDEFMVRRGMKMRPVGFPMREMETKVTEHWDPIDELQDDERENCVCIARCAWLDKMRATEGDENLNAYATADAWLRIARAQARILKKGVKNAKV